jgi:transcriptional regulator with XRE-family HTH domain
MGAFEDDLIRDLDNPEFRRAYVMESVRIATVDRIVNQLDDARVAAGLSKAALARAVGSNPDAIRRLLTARPVNPTLGTLAEMAAVFGLRVTLEPLPGAARTTVTTALLQEDGPDAAVLAAYLETLRTGPSDDLLSA